MVDAKLLVSMEHYQRREPQLIVNETVTAQNEYIHSISSYHQPFVYVCACVFCIYAKLETVLAVGRYVNNVIIKLVLILHELAVLYLGEP